MKRLLEKTIILINLEILSGWGTSLVASLQAVKLKPYMENHFISNSNKYKNQL